MGGFLLAKKVADFDLDATEKTLQGALDIFTKKGLKLNQRVETPEYVIYAFHKFAFPVENVVKFPDDQFIVATGTLIYNGKIGGESLKQLFNDFTESGEFLYKTFGQYCLIIYKNGKLNILNDAGGIYPVYCENNKSVFSNSLLAVSRTQPNLAISAQELFEYITSESFYGDKTLIKDIDVIDSNYVWQLSPNQATLPKAKNVKLLDTDCTFQEMIKQVGDNLIEYFTILKSAFGDSISSALSGGFDTRLMVALLRNVGVKPYLFVNGSRHSLDVKIARSIAEGEGLDLNIKYSDTVPKHDVDTYVDLLAKNYYWLDGIGEGYGVFRTDFDMNTRLKRSEKAILHMYGGGGEVYRNRLMLADRPFDLLPVLKSQLDNFPSSIFTGIFDRKEYFASLLNKCKTLYQNRVDNIDRQKLEKVYAFFTLKYHINNIVKYNNQFSYSIYPFTEISISSQSIDIPLKYKNFGYFNAALIDCLDPAIAKYDSQYGYRYSEYANIPFNVKLRNLMKTHSPLLLRTIVRKHLWRRKRVGKNKFRYYLKSPFLEEIFPYNDLLISKYINVDNIIESTMLSRALSVELLLNDRF